MGVFRWLREKFANWLLRDVHLRNVKFGENSVTMDTLITMDSQNPTAMGEIGMDTTTGRPSFWDGSQARPVAHTGEAGGGPPGTWTQLAKGPTTCNSGVTTVLATNTFTDGNLYLPMCMMRDTPPTTTRNVEFTRVAGGGPHYFFMQKLTSTGQVSINFNHAEGSAKQVDWVFYEVTPT